MFSLLESEVPRRIFIAARTKLRPAPSCRSRSADQRGAGSAADMTVCKLYSSGPGKKTGLDKISAAQTDTKKRTKIPKPPLAADARSVQTTLVRSYAAESSSKLPPHRGGRSNMEKMSHDLHVEDVEAFMHARPFEEIPGPTAMAQSIPFAGTRLLYYPFTNFPSHNMGNMLNRLQSYHGPVMRVRIGNDWVVLIETLQDIERVVRAAEQEDFNNEPAVTRISIKPESMFRTRVDDSALSWLDGAVQTQNLRAAISHHLNNNFTLASSLVETEKIAEELTRNLDMMQHCPRDMQTLCYRFAIESAAHMCYSQRIGLLGDNYLVDGEKQQLVDSYRLVLRCLGEILTGTRVLHMLFEDPFAKRFKEAKKVVNMWERQMTREATMHAVREKGVRTLVPEDRSLIMALMDDKAITEQEIASSMHALMTIGTDSVASSMQMLMLSLATNMEKQEKLAQEILERVGPDGTLTPGVLDSLDYLKACLKESLRLHFPVPAGGRVTLANNIVLSNYLVPAGTPIVVNSRRTAKNPVWFDRPHCYMPERWIGERSKKIPSLTFMPFGFGSNHCPSRFFAMQNIYTAIAKIVQKYKINLPSEYHRGQTETVYNIFRGPKEPLPFNFSPRTSSHKSSKRM